MALTHEDIAAALEADDFAQNRYGYRDTNGVVHQ